MHPVVQSLLWITASLVVLAVIITPFVWRYPAALDRLTPEDMNDEMGGPRATPEPEVTVTVHDPVQTPVVSLLAR